MRSVASLAADGYRHSADEGYSNLIHVCQIAETTARSAGVFKRQISIDVAVRMHAEAKRAGKEVAPKTEDMSLQGVFHQIR